MNQDLLIRYARRRLMPPQFDEFVLAINGGPVSEETREFWQQKMKEWSEWIEEDPSLVQ